VIPDLIQLGAIIDRFQLQNLAFNEAIDWGVVYQCNMPILMLERVSFAYRVLARGICVMR
jgi:hypothetical protein